MLTREQVYTMLILRNRADNIFSFLPNDLIRHISDINPNPNGDINIALRHAAFGTKEDIAIVVEMIKKNPRLLLQAGHVRTRGGIPVIRTTLYEFFLGEGDPASAKQIEFGFANIPNGENQRIRQYERYRPHIEALAKQIETKQPAYDLRPLIEIIKNSSAADITEALNSNDPNRAATRNTPLRAALAKFRRAVSPKRKTIGMHYEHYTTLIQALELLYNEWVALSNNYADYDKCRLVWRQIIGFLQRSLPAVDRFAFARAFDDDERTVNYKYDAAGSFPDAADAGDDLDLSGLGFDEAIFGVACVPFVVVVAAQRRIWKTHVEQKLQACRTYAATPKSENTRVCDLLKCS
jgi:hypothetical protein